MSATQTESIFLVPENESTEEVTQKPQQASDDEMTLTINEGMDAIPKKSRKKPLLIALIVVLVAGLIAVALYFIITAVAGGSSKSSGFDDDDGNNPGSLVDTTAYRETKKSLIVRSLSTASISYHPVVALGINENNITTKLLTFCKSHGINDIILSLGLYSDLKDEFFDLGNMPHFAYLAQITNDIMSKDINIRYLVTINDYSNLNRMNNIIGALSNFNVKLNSPQSSIVFEPVDSNFDTLNRFANFLDKTFEYLSTIKVYAMIDSSAPFSPRQDISELSDGILDVVSTTDFASAFEGMPSSDDDSFAYMNTGRTKPTLRDNIAKNTTTWFESFNESGKRVGINDWVQYYNSLYAKNVWNDKVRESV